MADSDNDSEPAEYLEWDSGFFGLRIARLRGRYLSDELTPKILAWCTAQQIDCLYFLAAADDGRTVELAERNDFSLLDVRITFERHLHELPGKPAGIRLTRPDDLEYLKRIAGRRFSDSRFYYDRNFDKARCDALYATWIERSCQGYADSVLVSDVKGEPAGFVTCNLNPSQTGSIGLLAVDTEAQGRGLGQRLVAAALHYFRENGMIRATVVTQGRNIKSQRLYQRSGFLVQSSGLWYHRWCLQKSAGLSGA